MEAYRALRLLGLALGRFTISCQVALQAIHRAMPTTAFEIDFFPGRPSPLPVEGAPSGAAWECIRSLHPPQKPSTGRPWHDHRMILIGILAVVGTGTIVARDAVGVWERGDCVQALPALV